MLFLTHDTAGLLGELTSDALPEWRWWCKIESKLVSYLVFSLIHKYSILIGISFGRLGACMDDGPVHEYHDESS